MCVYRLVDHHQTHPLWDLLRSGYPDAMATKLFLKLQKPTTMLVNNVFQDLNNAIGQFSKLKEEGFTPIGNTERIPDDYRVGDKAKCFVLAPMECRVMADETVSKKGSPVKWLLFLVRVKDEKGRTFLVSCQNPQQLQTMLAQNPNTMFEFVVGNYTKDGNTVKTASLILAPVAVQQNANPVGS